MNLNNYLYFYVFAEYTSIDKKQLRIREQILRVIEERLPGRDLPRVLLFKKK